MKPANIRFLQDGLFIGRFPWLRVGGKEIYYDDIQNIGTASKNGRTGSSVAIRLKNRREVRLDLHSDEDAKRFAEKVEEVIRPKVIKNSEPLPFSRFSNICSDLIGSQGPNIRKVVDFLVMQGICHQASDIHLEHFNDHVQIYFKIDGVIFPIITFEPDVGEMLINCIKVAAGMLLYRRDIIQEGRITQPTNEGDQDIRVSVLPSEPGERIVIRLFDKLKGESGLEDLGFSQKNLEQLKRISATPQGLFIICGPSGSGKTTTLYALLRHLKKIRGRLTSIITLEDPIEYRLSGITQVQVNSEGELTFAKTLKSSLRQDPGVIMVGEIRDTETANAAIGAALTGHLVLSTIHCSSAAEGITRLFDLGARPFLVNSALKGVLCQRLIRKVCSECLCVMETSGDEWESWNGKEIPISYVQGSGCEQCRNTGYHGRTVIAEFLLNRDKISDLINKTAETDLIERAAISQGMVPLRESGLYMIREKITDPKEIKRVIG